MKPRHAMTLAMGCFGLLAAAPAAADLLTLPRDQMIAFSPKNPFDRFDDGRPKIPDAMLERAKVLSAGEIWAALEKSKYTNQLETGWQILQPGKRLIGRALTAQFMPFRPDIAEVLDAQAKAAGRPPQHNQRVIDILKPGDVLVVDLFGKVEQGTFVGNNLAAGIYGATKTGFVFDGAVRDLEKVLEVGVPGYIRGSHPSAIGNVMLVGINVPVRIGKAIVMPGDLVVGDREGVYFVPPHLVEDCVVKAEESDEKDKWRKSKLLSGKYRSSDLYPAISQPDLKKEFEEFVKKKAAARAKLSPPKAPAP